MSDWKMDGKPALVIMHMQKGIVGTSSWKKSAWHDDVAKAMKDARMIEHIQDMLKAFRDKKLPVVFVSACPNPLRAVPAYGKLFKTIQEENVDPEILTSAATRESLEVIPELGRRPDEPLLFNWLLGAFTNSGLDLILKRQGVKTVVLAGFAAHSIVFTTALQAADLWYSIIIPRDASISHPYLVKATETIMDTLAPNIALVTSTADVIEHLQKW